MKNKVVIIIILILLIAIITGGVIFYLNYSNEKPEDVLNKYVSLINDKKYEEMYDQITEESKQSISKEDFVSRNKNIYEGIDALDLKLEIKEVTKDGNTAKISYTETMSTSAGNVTINNITNLKKQDKTYKIVWNSSQIFPQLRDTDKVRVSTLKSNRGEILDRNGVKLAENGKISSVGIVPGKLGENRDENISKISELTGVSTDYINTQLSASYVKDDTFVPIKKVAINDTELKEKLLEIPGIMINQVDARVYPLGEQTSHITGYVQAVSSEDLENNKGKGYTSSSIIGKAGLEYAYEDKIRGIDGVEIYIADEEGNKLYEIAKQDKQDGEDVKLTIDANLQSKLYEQLKEICSDLEIDIDSYLEE